MSRRLRRWTYRLLAIAFISGCAYTVGSDAEEFYVHVNNRSFSQVRVYLLTGFQGRRTYLGSVMPSERVRVPAQCGDFQNRPGSFVVHELAGGDWAVDGWRVMACSDSLVLYIPASGPKYASVEVWH